MNEKNVSENKLKMKLAAWRPWLWCAGILLVLLIAGIGTIVFLDWYYAGKTLPQQSYAGIEVGGLDPQRARAMIEQRWQQLHQRPLVFTYANEHVELTANELGVHFSSPEKSLAALTVAEHWWQPTTSLLNTKTIPVYVKIDPIVVENKLYNNFDQLIRKQNAYFKADEAGAIMVEPEQAGQELVWAPLYEQFLASFARVNPEPLLVNSQISLPTITEKDLLAVQDQFLKLVDRQMTLVAEGQEWPVNWRQRLDQLRFAATNKDVATGLPYELAVDPKTWLAFIDEEVAPAVEQPTENVELKLIDDRVEFSGKGQDGRRINRQQLLTAVNAWLNKTENTPQLTVPIETVKTEIVVGQELEKMGVVDLVAVGYTSYYGSPANRMHNIRVGLDKFNGTVIQPGATFSFNDNLGPVESYTGYLPELVIKPEGTIPEYGGGLCQVSTTFYRAVLNADLPVEERNPHSYAVSYYAQQMGHGLDATIYPGASDLKFTNTTQAPLVVQAYADGAEAYFKLYGQPQNKEISYDGPYISRRVGPPAPVYIKRSSLPPGTKKQVESPHSGFDVVWYKTVKHADGSVEKKELFSRYRAIPAKFLVGPDPQPASEIAEDSTSETPEQEQSSNS